jgi:hypothetical protein
MCQYSDFEKSNIIYILIVIYVENLSYGINYAYIVGLDQEKQRVERTFQETL